MYTWKVRKNLRLQEFDYASSGFYFVTICTKNRENFFWYIKEKQMNCTEIWMYAEECWNEIPMHFPNSKIHEFVIMPNHIHWIIEIDNTYPENVFVGNENFRSLHVDGWKSLSSIIKWFKIGVTKKSHTSWTIDFAWQKSFYDVIIWSEEQLNNTRKYIQENPLLWENDINFHK